MKPGSLRACQQDGFVCSMNAHDVQHRRDVANILWLLSY